MIRLPSIAFEIGHVAVSDAHQANVGSISGARDVKVKVEVPDERTMVAGEGTITHIQIYSDGNAQMALNAALQDSVGQLFADPAFVDVLLKSGTPAGLTASQAN
jgi:hypothetical protein